MKPNKIKKKVKITEEAKKNKLFTEILTSPDYQSSQLIYQLQGLSTPPAIADIMACNQKKKKQIFKGNLKPLKNMLFHQAQVLDSLFYYYARKIQHTPCIEAQKIYSHIAFKAQRQCQATLQAMVHTQFPPPMTVIQQQNNALQQDIYQTPVHINSQEQSKNSKNELLEVISHDKLDIRATASPSSTHSAMETLAEGPRPQDSGRKTYQQNECL